MTYIDFDDVIMDTYLAVFGDYQKEDVTGQFISDIEYVKNKDWHQALKESTIISDSINIIKNLDINTTCILTKVHSLTNEGSNKIKFLRENGVMCPIILVPHDLKKTDVVNAKGNTLIDDSIFNLDAWSSSGGTAIFFSKNNNDTDGWGFKNTKYQKVTNLELLKNKEYKESV